MCDEFCLIHGYEHMRTRFGEVMAHCEACEMDKEMQRALEADGEKLRQLTGEDHGPWSPFRLIFDALAANEISAREAIEQVLYHPEYGGNREDAESVVEEWSVQINQQEEQAALERR